MMAPHSKLIRLTWIASALIVTIHLTGCRHSRTSFNDKARLPLFGAVIDGAAPRQKMIFGSKNQVGYSLYSLIPVGEHLFLQELNGVRHRDGKVEAATNS